MVPLLLTIFNLFILEVMLSVDNCAVLAIMVKDLPIDDRSKALKYGILGAFLMRGASLFCVSFLIKLLFLKVLGGLYLLYLVYGHFSPSKDTLEEVVEAKDRRIYSFVSRRLHVNQLWATIILVELMDMTFSIDNIFASVAMTQNFTLILIGVFLGIIAMRFVAGLFSRLMYRFPSLESSAYVVIGLLGLKLIAQAFLPETNSHIFDFAFSGVMLLVFLFPILKHKP